MRRAALVLAFVSGCAVTADPQRALDQAAKAEARLGLSGERALDGVAELTSRAGLVADATARALDGAAELEKAATADLTVKPSRGVEAGAITLAVLVVVLLVLHGALEAARIRSLVRSVHEDVKKRREEPKP